MAGQIVGLWACDLSLAQSCGEHSLSSIRIGKVHRGRSLGLTVEGILQGPLSLGGVVQSVLPTLKQGTAGER